MIMLKRKYDESLFLLDIPRDVLRLVVSYSPNDFLLLCKLMCNVVRGLRSKIDVRKAVKLMVNPKSIAETIFSSPNIRSLNVSGWSKWDNCFIYTMSNLVKRGHYASLEHLFMSNCHKITSKSIRTLIAHLKKHLKTLDLFNCRNVSFYAINFQLPELKTLLLGYSKIPNTSTSDYDVLKHLLDADASGIKFPKLTELQLYNITQIKSLSPLLHITSTLRVLDIRGCTGIKPQDLSIISRLEGLEELHIGLCVDAEVLKEITKNCNKLSILDISGSLISLEVVESIAANLTLLKRLKLSKCSSLTNNGLKILLTRLTQLNVIDISHCWRITDSFSQSIEFIASGNNLEKIGIYMCSLDQGKLLYNLNKAGANNVMVVVHYELQIITNKLHVC